MAPAFSSTRQAGAYVLLMLALLLSPLLVQKRALPQRENVYSSIPWRSGSFPYMGRQIFDEKGDLDIVFMGSSHMYNGIDTPYVQQQLSGIICHQATVISLCWNYSGFDALYIFARDLLEHRKVRLLVFCDDLAPNVPANQPHVESWRWIRIGDDGVDLVGLPLTFRISYYYGAVVGMPRNLLNLLRPNLPSTVSPEQFSREHPHLLFPPDRLGAHTSQLGYIDRPDLFEDYLPQTAVASSDVCRYSTKNRDKFQFQNTLTAPLQAHFAEKFILAARLHSTRLVCLKLPTMSEQRDKTILENRISIETLYPESALVGIVPAQLFAGLSDIEVRKLYEDPVHMNQNGQAYFTRIITPELIRIYEEGNH
jgi:hypothetical protein